MKRFSIYRIQTKYLLWVICVLFVAAMYFWWSSVRFGDTFPNPLQSKNVHLDCTFNGLPICCGLVEESSPYNAHHAALASTEGAGCYVTKVYEPSPYEVKHVKKSHELASVADEKTRRDELLTFMFADIPDSNIWLERVRDRMLSGDASVAPTSADWDYLSRFVVTEQCTAKHPHSGHVTTTSRTWHEWIEPLTVHMRHPFGFTQCFTGWWPEPYWVGAFQDREDSMDFKAGLMLADYVLLQSSRDKIVTDAGHNRTAGRRPGHSPRQPYLRAPSSSTALPAQRQLQFSAPAVPNEPTKPVKNSAQGKSFFFDVGTSKFDSALFWFICGYLQNGIRFDEIFGWEATLLEPTNFWTRVPKLLIPYYHFLNTYISAQADDAQSVLRVIKQATVEEDFVSLKLDIDTPEVEIPIVQQLVADEALHRLVDEFFFELHFRCEIMMYCGWRDQMPVEFNGLRLDRPHAMELFSTLRKKGIRAHVWP